VSPPDPRQVLARHGLFAKKSWGQNFLVDMHAHAAIAAATVGSPNDWVLEIGAGLGTLTHHLAAAATAGRVIAVERDRQLIPILRAELAGAAHVEIREENALTLDYAALAVGAPGGKLAVAGNLPYQIASPLLFAILAARAHVARAVVMLQREMAERILAAPATPEYGALGVLLGAYLDGERVLRVRAGSFYPAPRVDSAVVRLVPRATPRVRGDAERFAVVVHAAFGQRRKMLRNALAAVFGDAAAAALAATGISGERRGETLTIEEFDALTCALGAGPSPS
jgi:16S rRNA (adenine1518-N6/adenine1519-N6)-dimethyltransferase